MRAYAIAFGLLGLAANPPPSAKLNTIQRANVAPAVSRILRSTSTLATGKQQGPTLQFNVACPDGGRMSGSTTISGLAQSGGAYAGTGSVTQTVTFTGCKTNNETITGGPITTTLTIKPTTGQPVASYTYVWTYQTAAIAFETATWAGTFSNLNLTVTITAPVTAMLNGPSTTASNLTETVNGTVTIGGVTHTYANESMTVGSGAPFF